MYLPAIHESYDLIADYQSKNLSSIVTGRLNVYVFPAWYDRENKDYFLSWEMETARIIVRGQWDAYNVHTADSQIQVPPPPMQVPLWRWDDSDGGRPLLAVSPGPFLYPFTWIYYWFNMGFFAAIHFWLALLGLILLTTTFPVKLKLFARPLLVFLIILFLPQIRFDLAAGFAWWLMGVALAYTLADKRFSIKLAVLSFIFAMLLLAVSLPISLFLTCTLVVWWLFVSGWKNNWRVLPIAKGCAGLIVAVGISVLLAGPQLSPRIFDRMEVYQFPPDHTPIYLPPTASINSIIRVGQGEMVYNLMLQGSSSPMQLIIPERYDAGWTAEYRTSLNSSTYQPIPITRTAEGWRSLTLPAISQATSLEIRTVYDPVSFRIGLWSFLAGLVVWLCITGFAVISWLAKVYTDNYNSAKAWYRENSTQ